MEKQSKTIAWLLVIVSIAGLFTLYGGKVVNASSRTIKDSEIERLSVDAEILEDNTVRVRETFYYNTDDKNGIKQHYSYKRSKNEHMDLEAVFVNGIKSTLVSQGVIGDAGVYTFDDSGEKQTLMIYQPINGRTIFTTQYRVSGLIKQYNDVQDLNWKIYDATMGSTPLKLDAIIKFPVAIKRNQIRVFGHGDVEGTINIDKENIVKIDITGFYEHTFSEVHILLPGNPLPGIKNKINESKLDSIMAYEQQEAEKTNEQVIVNGKKTNNTNLLLIGLLVIWLLAIMFFFGIFILFYRKYDAEQYTSELTYYREVPPYSPAVAALILDSATTTSQAQLIATIFNLYTKKLLAISEFKKDIKIKLLKKPSMVDRHQLKPDELHVYQWLSDSFGEKNEGTYKEFFNIGKHSGKKAVSFDQNYTTFKNKVLHEYRQLDFEQYKGRNAKIPLIMYIFGFIFIACTGLIGIWQVFGTIHTVGFIVMVLLALLFFGAFGLLIAYKNNCYQLTKEGAKQKAQVKGLKKYLNDYSLLSEARPAALHLWEKYFVYGLALGVSKKALHDLYQSIPQAAQNSPDWQTIYMMHYLSHNFNIVSRSEKAVFAMNNTIESAQVSRTSGAAGFGSGGGFSGGGGFGSGGTSSSSF